MNKRTIYLTAKEISDIETVPIFSEQQHEMLKLRKRSGIRYGVQVGKGLHDIVTTAFALNKKGEPTGGCDVTIIRGGLLAHEVISAIKALS